jgi:hypothetical protein
MYALKLLTSVTLLLILTIMVGCAAIPATSLYKSIDTTKAISAYKPVEIINKLPAIPLPKFPEAYYDVVNNHYEEDEDEDEDESYDNSYDQVEDDNSEDGWDAELPTVDDLFKITVQDPVMKFDTYISNYKLFKFKMDGSKKYTINIASVCCFSTGTQSREVVPVVSVVDAKGNNIQYKLGDKKEILELFRSTTYLQLHITAPETSYYYLIVSADNKDPGKVIKSWTTYTPIGVIVIPIQSNIYSNPFGEFRVNYIENNAGL